MTPQPCEGLSCSAGPDAHDLKTSFCQICSSDYCDECWPKQPPHLKEKQGHAAHERLPRRLIQILEPILKPSRDPQVREKLLRNDVQSKWFAWHKDEDGEVYFQNFERYHSLMVESTPEDSCSARYPHLVAVIGPTGNGKSSIVKMLIDLFHVDNSDHELMMNNATPVVGAIGDNLPTTGNVHLYADSETWAARNPILFADMEGLGGGNMNPVADSRENDIKEHSAHGAKHSPHGLRYELRHKFRGSYRVLWATNPEMKSREHAVSHLYPKLLYTFSDVILFVMRGDLRSSESVLGQLINWASNSMEKSLNQPMLPHAIIAANFTDNDIDEREWDVEHATERFLRDFRDVVNHNPRFQALKRDWEQLGCPINSLEDLLLRYYSSISVIRIPQKDSYMGIKRQIDKLRAQIRRRCDESHERKRHSRLLLDSQLLQTYLTAGFEHFLVDLDRPFNFIDAAMRINPISRDFQGNILQLAVLTYKKSVVPKQSLDSIFNDKLAELVASCILLDILRKQFPGQPSAALDSYYKHICNQAFDKFVSHVWPCSFKNRNGETCANVQASHQKGHQNIHGKIIEAGEYEILFNIEQCRERWHKLLERYIKRLDDLRVVDINSKAYWLTHTGVLKECYRAIDPELRYRSHSACFSCLHAFPEHSLPCGHVLCTRCIEDHGEVEAPGEIIIQDCPLHVRSSWPDVKRIHMKPPSAGVRVLSLDGGGVRGIVILEHLKALSEYLPKGLEAQHFFDLIVGTSTGGLIAMGLGVKGWTIDEAIEKFKTLANDAFTRNMLAVPGAFLSRSGSLYKTQSFEDALRFAFGDSNLFGGKKKDSKTCTKVAVVSATTAGHRPVIFTNYNRKVNKKIPCDWEFERPQDPEEELKLWQVGRATSAAPPYFKPFIHPRSRREYIDGAVYYKNPAKLAMLESKLVYPDTVDQEPDLLLSIGTGEDASNPYFHPPKRGSSLNRIAQERTNDFWEISSGQRRASGFQWPFFRLFGKFQALKDFMSRTLDAERAWATFFAGLEQRRDTKTRYQRFNLKFEKKDFPRMDDIGQVETLQNITRTELSMDECVARCKRVAKQLVASSFHFHIQKQMQNPLRSHCTCTGTILCRFPNKSEELRNLGCWLQKFSVHDFQPYFEIRKRDVPGAYEKVEFGKQVIKGMIDTAHFEIRQITIPMHFYDDEATISLVLAPMKKYAISRSPLRLLPGPPQSPLLMQDDMTDAATSVDTASVSPPAGNRPTSTDHGLKSRRATFAFAFTKTSIHEAERKHADLGVPPVEDGSKTRPTDATVIPGRRTRTGDIRERSAQLPSAANGINSRFQGSLVLNPTKPEEPLRKTAQSTPSTKRGSWNGTMERSCGKNAKTTQCTEAESSAADDCESTPLHPVTAADRDSNADAYGKLRRKRPAKIHIRNNPPRAYAVGPPSQHAISKHRMPTLVDDAKLLSTSRLPVRGESIYSIVSAMSDPSEDVIAKRNVYRVESYFDPLANDEMEVKVGECVYVWRTYDDGWAYCSTLDKSREGMMPCQNLSGKAIVMPSARNSSAIPTDSGPCPASESASPSTAETTESKPVLPAPDPSLRSSFHETASTSLDSPTLPWQNTDLPSAQNTDLLSAQYSDLRTPTCEPNSRLSDQSWMIVTTSEQNSHRSSPNPEDVPDVLSPDRDSRRASGSHLSRSPRTPSSPMTPPSALSRSSLYSSSSGQQREYASLLKSGSNSNRSSMIQPGSIPMPVDTMPEGRFPPEQVESLHRDLTNGYSDNPGTILSVSGEQRGRRTSYQITRKALPPVPMTKARPSVLGGEVTHIAELAASPVDERLLASPRKQQANNRRST